MKFPEQHRWVTPPFQSNYGDQYGRFLVSGSEANGRALQIIANAACEDCEWDHVSVSIYGQPKQCPSWKEMCIIKDLFWDEDQCVVQFHPPKADYVNVHEGCLHLWNKPGTEFPRPPRMLVG